MKKRKIHNNLVYLDYYSRLKEMALSMYKWTGLPETCDERFLEKTLFQHGRAIFVLDEEMGFLNLKCTPADTLNVYENPLSYTAYSIGYSKMFSNNDVVIIRNNYLNLPTETTIRLYAERLATLELAIQVNINAQRTPLMIRCDEKTKKSLEILYEQYQGDKPVIFGTKALSDKPIEAILTGAPFVADKLREEKRAVWNECLEFLGLNTNPSDKKKERLIVDEVNVNNEQISIQCETMLLTRQNACELINKKFGLNVSVEKRLSPERSVDNGSTYNRTADDSGE